MLKPKRVRVYRNLHNHLLSIKCGSVVIGHCLSITLVNPKFIVQEAGKKRAIETGVRNVHAFVEGEIHSICGFVAFKNRAYPILTDFKSDKKLDSVSEIGYNPFSNRGFFIKSTPNININDLVFNWIKITNLGEMYAQPNIRSKICLNCNLF